MSDLSEPSPTVPMSSSTTNVVRRRQALLTRATARRTQDGAVIFITAMTLAVLTSLALYSLAQTRGEVKASGYGTREMMSEGIESWALNMEMSHLTTNGVAAADIKHAQNTTDYNPQQSPNIFHGCLALANVPPTTANSTVKMCTRLGMSAYIGSNSALPQAYPQLYISAASSYNATPDIYTEMTEPVSTIVPGNAFAGSSQPLQSYLVTVSIYGMLRINNGASINTSIEVVKQGRAHLVVQGGS